MTYNGDSVYVGTSVGKLLHYTIAQRYSATGKLEYEASKVCEATVGKGPVQQLEVIGDIKSCITLCDGAVGLWFADTLRRGSSGTLDQKGAVMFAVNLKGPTKYKLCIVSSKRRLRLFEWTPSASQYSYVKDLDLPDIPRALVYVGQRLWVGYSREYNVIYEDTGEVKDLLDAALTRGASRKVLGRESRPLLKFVPGEEMLVLLGDDEAVQLPLSGEPPTAPWVQFKARPLAVGYCYPYLISVSDGASKLEVHAARAGRDELVHQLTMPPGVVGIADGRVGATSRTSMAYTDAGKGRNPIYVAFASPGTVMRLQPVPVDRQIEDMMRQFQAHAAQELLLNTAPEPAALLTKLNRMNIDAARVLLLGLHFEHAFQHLIASPIDVRDVLSLFPDVQLCATAAAAALSPQASATADSSSSSLSRTAASPALLARAYCTPARYFSAALLRDVARGVSKPADGASAAADAYVTDDAAPVSLDPSQLDACVTGDARSFVGVCTGPVAEDERAAALTCAFATGAPDIGAIITAGLDDYRSRLLTDDKRVAITSPAALRDGTAAARLAVAHEGLLKFLRVRRAAVMAALRGEAPVVACTIAAAGTAPIAEAGMSTSAFASAAAASASSAGIALYAVAGGEAADAGEAHTVHSLAVAIPSLKSVAKAMASIPPVTAYTCANARPAELQALALAIDTAIMKILLKSRRFGALDRMLTRPNALDTCDAVATLRAHGRFHSVALLLRTRGMAREALTVWRDLGTAVCTEERDEADSDVHVRSRRGSDDDRPRIDSLSDDEALDVEAVDDELTGELDASDTAPAVRYDGVRESIAFLRRENNMNLVEEFGEWLLRLDPRASLPIFTRPHPSRITHAMPDAVIAYLSSDKFAGTSRDALRLYLEFLLYDSGRNEDRFHTLLLHTYLDSVAQLRGEVDTPAASIAAAPASGAASPISAISVLEVERMLGGTRADRARPGYEGGRLGDVRADLIRLLQESGEMDAQRLLNELRTSTLYEERVLLHARMSQHMQALSLLVRELADHGSAVRYCLLTSVKRNAGVMSDGAQQASTARSADTQPFLILLQLYIAADRAYRTHAATIAAKAKAASGVAPPPRTTSIFLDRALDVITRHAEYMHPRDVAALLPDDLPLAASGAYWNAVLPAAAHAAREAALVRNLYNFELISVHASLIERQARAGEMTRVTTCAVCDKRIGDAVFALLPARDDAPPAPVHFHCLKEVPTTFTTAVTRAAGEDYGARVLGLSLGTRASGSGSSPADAALLPLYDVPSRKDGRSYALARVRARETAAVDAGATPATVAEDGPPLLDDAGVRVSRSLPLLDVRAFVRGGVLVISRDKYVLRSGATSGGNRASVGAAAARATSVRASIATGDAAGDAERRGQPSTAAAVSNLASAIVETHYGASR